MLPGGDRIGSVTALCASIEEALIRYPHFVVLPPAIGGAVPGFARRLTMALANRGTGDCAGAPAGEAGISFTRVKINPRTRANRDNVTRYSRTHLPLPPHTDSSYAKDPHNLVVFHMVTPDPDGGETTIVPIEDVLERLTESAIEQLSRPVYPFGNTRYAVLLFSHEGPRIRYYRQQLDHSARHSNSLDCEARNALESLDHVLASLQHRIRFKLNPGEVLIVHNTAALHGRTAFAPDSQRLLLRVRAHSHRLRMTGAATTAPESGFHPFVPRYASVATSGVSDDAVHILRLAGTAWKQHHRRRAFEHLMAALAIAPADHRVLDAVGEFHLRAGNFAQAMRFLDKSVRLKPNNTKALRDLAALHHRRGNLSKARYLACKAAAIEPIAMPHNPVPGAPTVMRVNAVENGHYGIRWNKAQQHYVRRLCEGHFSTRHLLKGARLNTAIANLAGNNLAATRLPGSIRLIINTVSCPDIHAKALMEIRRLLARHPELKVINRPELVLETSREATSRRLKAIPGVRCPETIRVRHGGNVASTRQRIRQHGIAAPILIRRTGTHTGDSLVLAVDDSTVDAFLQGLPAHAEFYVSPYIDCRDERGLFRKMRAFFIDGKFHPVACLANDHWQIHSNDRYRIMYADPNSQIQERRYLRDPESYLGPENLARLYKIRDAIPLDFFGVDFALTPDNELLVFEANAVMRHNFDHADAFPYTRPYLEQISAAFQAMVLKRAG